MPKNLERRDEILRPLKRPQDDGLYDCFAPPNGGVRNDMSGLTLLELIITLVLVSVLTGAIYAVYDTGFRTFYTQNTRSGVKGETGRLFLNVAGELRQATSVTSAQAASVTFTLDSDSNGLDETLQYTWSGTAGAPLNRVASSPAPSYTIPVVSSVTSAAFSYYDSNDNLLSFPVTASQVRLVAVDLTVTDKDETFHLISKARLRNL